MDSFLPRIIDVLIPAAVSFAIGIGLAPLVSHYLYKWKAWKKRPGKISYDGTQAEEFFRLHQHSEVRAPRMGGIIIWLSVLLTALFFMATANLAHTEWWRELNFLSRNQTWVPLATLLVGAIVGLVDDWLVIAPDGKGLSLSYRLLVVMLLSLWIGAWFYFKLDVSTINIPFYQPLFVGWGIIPLFMLISLALYASGVIDGIDGLSGGVFASIFGAYATVAFFQMQTDIAALCAAILGGILAFLWFNIPPARFYMSDTGTMALTLSLAVIAFMTDALGNGYGVSILPIVGGLLVATVVSDVLQISWKKLFGRKLFLIAPLHHHFEALGWPGAKVVMRYWVISVILAFAGVLVAIAAH